MSITGLKHKSTEGLTFNWKIVEHSSSLIPQHNRVLV